MTRILAIALLALTLASPAHAVPCFPSVEAARAHGVTGWLVYQKIHGPKEWFRGHKGQHVKCDVASNTVSVLDRPRSRSTHKLDTPKAAGADRISQSPPPERTVMPDESRKDSTQPQRPPESRPPSATGAVSPPPEWTPVVVKTEPAKWPDEVRLDPPPLTMTAEQVKAAPVEEEPPASMTKAFTGGGAMLLGLLGEWWLARDLRRKA